MQKLRKAKSVLVNPSQQEIKSLVSKMTSAQKTEFGSFNINTKVYSRSAKSTFLVSGDEMGQAQITREEYEKIAKLQDEHTQNQDMLLIEGFIGLDHNLRVGCRLYIEQSQANIAAMQQQLFFKTDDDFIPQFTIICTPTLFASGYPNDRLVAVDLRNYTTRIKGTDYFGETKKSSLRMWNKWVYDHGGLALHAGCKLWPDINGKEKMALIIRLSGTGKTTLTFSQQLGSKPVQDDFCALFLGGAVYASENGCFAKTIDLDSRDAPNIYRALTQSDAWLENVSVSRQGKVDFKDSSVTSNGRGTFLLEKIPHHNPANLPKVDFIMILNRNFNVIPAVAKLKPVQAAAYFMLGETTGTSAGGADEEGKFLHVPGTNPFFMANDALQGNRFLELLQTMPDTNVYLLNTGCIGGTDNDPQSKKVHIQHSSAIQEGVVCENIEWREDEDFGYFIANLIPGIDDPELLNPRLLYEREN